MGYMALIAITAAPADSLAGRQTAEAAVSQALAAIANNRPDEVFAMLPESYRNDINTVVSTFAKTMDAEVWNSGRGIARRLAAILGGKRDLIAPMLAAQFGENAEIEAAKTSLASISTILGQISRGSLTDIELLRQGNVQALLAGEGRQVMREAEKIAKLTPAKEDDIAKDPWTLARNAKVRLVKSEGDQATVTLDGVEDAEDMELIRVDGAWVPAEMAEDWRQRIDEALKTIRELDYTSDEGKVKKARTLAMMGMLNGVLGQIEKAETAEELQHSMMGIMMMIGGAMGGSPQVK